MYTYIHIHYMPSAVYCKPASLCDTCSLLMFATWQKHVGEIIHFNNRSTLPWDTTHYLRFTVSPLHYVTLAYCSCLPPGKNTRVKFFTLSIDKSVASAVYCALTSLCDTCSLLMFAPWRKHVAEIIHSTNRNKRPARSARQSKTLA